MTDSTGRAQGAEAQSGARDPQPALDAAAEAWPAGRPTSNAEEPKVPADASRICQVCGRQATDAELLSWVMDRRAGKVSWTCARCAAANIRALEAKLEPEWW